MLSSRRTLMARALRCAGVFTAGLALSTAFAQTAKPVRILVGFPAGGGSDVIARLLADKLKDQLDAPVLVENRPGAGGQIAAQALKGAPADGSTLFLSHDHTISRAAAGVQSAFRRRRPRPNFWSSGSVKSTTSTW